MTTATQEIDLLEIVENPSIIRAHGLSRWHVGALLRDLFWGRTSSMIYITCEHADRLRDAGFRLACAHYPGHDEGHHNIIFPTREED